MLLKRALYSFYILSFVLGAGGCAKDSGDDVNTALAAPAGFAVSSQTASSVVLVWSAVTDAASYTVYRSASLTGSYARVQASIGDVPYTDSDLDQGSNYFFKVSAVNGGGEGPLSEAVSATTAHVLVSTLAGSRAQGNADGTGLSATFRQPTGIAVNSSGTVYVSDCLNHTIRAITSAGVVSTLAGSGTQGSSDGTGAAASFYYPSGLAVSWDSSLYVADLSNY